MTGEERMGGCSCHKSSKRATYVAPTSMKPPVPAIGLDIVIEDRILSGWGAVVVAVVVQ